MIRYFVPLALLFGCATDIADEYAICTVRIDLEPSSGAPGDAVVATGGPFAATWDTRVQVAGVAAEIVDVLRTDCGACDECRDELGCGSCGRCAGCADTCESCVQQAVFTVPTVQAGATEVIAFTRHGSSDAVDFKVIVDGEAPPVP